QDIEPVPIEHECSRRHANDQVSPSSPMAVCAATGPAGLRTPELAVRNLGKVVRPRHRANDHRPSVPAIAAVRPAARHILLAPEATAAPAAVAAFDVDGDTVDEHAQPVIAISWWNKRMNRYFSLHGIRRRCSRAPAAGPVGVEELAARL